MTSEFQVNLGASHVKAVFFSLDPRFQEQRQSGNPKILNANFRISRKKEKRET